MGKSADVPAPPDPEKTAAAQYKYNMKAAQYGLDNSRTATVNPFGSSRWTNTPTFDQAGFDAAMAAYRPAQAASYGPPGSAGQIPAITSFGPEAQSSAYTGAEGVYTPAREASGDMPTRADFERNNWTNVQTLSPESQGIYDLSSGKLQEALGGLSTNPDQYNSKVADAIYSRMRRYQDPADAEARNVLQSNLADRGFQIGNEATGKEMTRLDEVQGRGRADAADQSVIQGMTQGRANTAQLAQIAQLLQGLRGAQVGGVSGAGMSPTTTTPTVQAPDYTGLVNQQYASQVDAANAEAAGDNAMFGSLLSLGGMALGSPWLGSAMGFGGGAAGAGAGAAMGAGLRAPKTGFWG